MHAFLQPIIDQVAPSLGSRQPFAMGILMGILIPTLSSYLGRRQKLREKAEQMQNECEKAQCNQWLDILNISLNIYEDGWLLLRTLHEGPLSEVLPNLHHREYLEEQAAKCKANDSPIILLDECTSQAYIWQVKNKMLNFISAKYSEGAIRLAMLGSEAVQTDKFVFAFTEEQAWKGKERNHKWRVMLMKERQLRDFYEHKKKGKKVKMENQWCQLRIETLLKIAEAHFNKDKTAMFSKGSIHTVHLSIRK